jgi:ubiquinone/menaquinone biosynthesis C-methylase UbiE
LEYSTSFYVTLEFAKPLLPANGATNPQLTENPKAYNAIADLYDCEYPHALPVKISFWKQILERFGGPALKLAVGSRRIALELSERGHQIDGIDSSQSMLNIAREKLVKANGTHRGR